MRDLDRTFNKARQMQKGYGEAAAIRCRYLYDRIGSALESRSDIADHWVFEDIEEALYLLEKSPILDARKNSPYEEKVLDIEGAKAYPIDNLIDFKNGWAVAWCHPDRKPSLFHSKKTNRAICWACNKPFDTIAVLMERDSMTFIEAVKFLTR